MTNSGTPARPETGGADSPAPDAAKAPDSRVIVGLEAVVRALDSAFPWERRSIEPSGGPVRLSILQGRVGGIRLVKSTRYYSGWSKASHLQGAAEEPLVVVGFNLRKGMILEPQGGGVLHTAENEVLITPYRPGSLVRREFGSTMLFLSFPATLVADILARHFHMMDARPLFALQVLPDSQATTALRRLAMTAIEDLTNLPSTLGPMPRAVLERQYQDTLATLLLLNLPHSLSDALNHAGQGGESRHIRRALDFIHANLEESLSLDGIAAAAHCSPRQLQLVFRKQLDTTPMALVKKLRLEAADAGLRSGRYRSVTDAAFALGFNHLGRFASQYQERFGYRPRQALLGGAD